MMSLFLSAVIFLFAPAPAPAPQTAACERHREPAAGFSLCPPEGWKATEVKGQEYKVLIGPRINNATPNMIVKTVPFDGTLQDFVTSNVDELGRHARSGALKSYRLVSRAPFTTLAGQKGSKIIIHQEVAGNLVRQSFYAFDGRAEQKLIFTYTVLAEGGEREDELFDESMKTLRLETTPPPPGPHPKNHR